ncbi:Multidrug resistance protein MdtE [Halioglobus japonicus]|nr:Multidrug resistance protein MdtE [Halioglobus japonicus]
MNKIPRTLLLAAAALLILALLVAAMAGVFTDKIAPGLAAPVTIDTSEAIAVTVQQVPFTESVPASIEARETTIISSRLLARITGISVRAGDVVEPGQLLIELEKSDLLARAQQAREQILAVQARVTQARQNLARAEELHKRGLIAIADRDAARANAAALEADLGAAQQTLQEAETAVSFTDIRSPIAGRIVDRFAEPGDTATPSQKLLALYNPFSLQVEAWVREQLALTLKPGEDLQVEVPSVQRTFTARIQEIVPAADPGSRSFLVRAILPSDQTLLPGMYARLQVFAGYRPQLLVAADRVANVGQLDVVWVARKGVVERRFVRLGQAGPDGMVEVISGLASGDLVLPRQE